MSIVAVLVRAAATTIKGAAWVPTVKATNATSRAALFQVAQMASKTEPRQTATAEGAVRASVTTNRVATLDRTV